MKLKHALSLFILSTVLIGCDDFMRYSLPTYCSTHTNLLSERPNYNVDKEISVWLKIIFVAGRQTPAFTSDTTFSILGINEIDDKYFEILSYNPGTIFENFVEPNTPKPKINENYYTYIFLNVKFRLKIPYIDHILSLNTELNSPSWNENEKKMYNRHYSGEGIICFGWNYNKTLEIADFVYGFNVIAEEGSEEYNNFFDMTIDPFK
jgi:hypothetical protein